MTTNNTTTTKKTTTTTAKRNKRTHRKAKVDVYQSVTDAIVKQIEDGLNGSWRRPWVAAP